MTRARRAAARTGVLHGRFASARAPVHAGVIAGGPLAIVDPHVVGPLATAGAPSVSEAIAAVDTPAGPCSALLRRLLRQ